jgi:hypothetical protein
MQNDIIIRHELGFPETANIEIHQNLYIIFLINTYIPYYIHDCLCVRAISGFKWSNWNDFLYQQTPSTPSTALTKISKLLSFSLWRFFSFLILHTVGRTPWTGDQPVSSPLPTHRKTQTQNKRTQTSTPNEIRTHYPSVRAAENGSCLRPRGHSDQPKLLYNKINMNLKSLPSLMHNIQKAY